MQVSDRVVDEQAEILFAGPGEMRRRSREFDWTGTALGPVSGWPQSLRTTLRTMLASRNPMFLWWGPELVQFYNDAYRPSFGENGRHPAALGMRGADCWTDIWSTIGPQIDGVMRAGEATWHEDQYLPIERNGQLEDVWWTYGYSPVFDDDGSIGGTLVTCMETTARMMAERERAPLLAALAVERARLADVFKQAPAFLAVVRGPDHIFELVNDAYYQLVGHRELLGTPVFDALPELRGQGFQELLDGVLATGERFIGREMPVMLARTPGATTEQRFVDLTYLPLIEDDGTRGGIIAHGTDITEQVLARREVERLLASSEQARAELEAAWASAERSRHRTDRLQSLTASLAAAHSMDDVAAVVVSQMTAALGSRTGAIAVRAPDGDELHLLRQSGFTPGVLPTVTRQPLTFASPLVDCFLRRTPVWVESLHGPDGLESRYPAILPVWTEVGIASGAFIPLVIAGEVVGAISFGFAEAHPFDESDRAFLLSLGQQTALAVERARLFEAEHVARQEAEAANRTKAEFLATMSHELRTPLNAIGGYAELIEMGVRGPVTAEQRTDLARIQRSQRHLLGLINGVLNYAKLDAGAVNYMVEDVPMDEVVATCESLVSPQARAKGLSLTTLPYPMAAPVARADREKTQQVLLNLLSNAIKFTESGGAVTMGCSLDGSGHVLVRVHDTGRGIAPAFAERVFQPFVQVDSTLTRSGDGTGLGLAISRDLARGMGGDLTLERTSPEGSTFTLALPAA